MDAKSFLSKQNKTEGDFEDYLLTLEQDIKDNQGKQILIIEQEEDSIKKYFISPGLELDRSFMPPINTRIIKTLKLGILGGELSFDEKFNLIIPTIIYVQKEVNRWELKEGIISIWGGSRLLNINRELSPGEGNYPFQQGIIFKVGNNNVEDYFKCQWDKGLDCIPALIQLEQEIPERFKGVYLEKIKTLVDSLQNSKERKDNRDIERLAKEAEYFGLHKTDITLKPYPGIIIEVSKYVKSLLKK